MRLLRSDFDLEGFFGRLAQAPARALVLVSGRPAESLQGLLDLSPAPEVWGSHGRERSRGGLPEGGRELPRKDLRALLSLEEWITSEAGESALERKPFGVIHSSRLKRARRSFRGSSL